MIVRLKGERVELVGCAVPSIGKTAIERPMSIQMVCQNHVVARASI
jgi:hypothetical protein